MLKGVNKLIVEINNPESDYFERAIFFVKPSKGDVPSFELTDSASHLIRSAMQESGKKKNKRGHALLKMLCAAFLGAFAAAVIMQFL